MVSKYDDNQIRHMEMQENANREWVYDAILKILHVSGPINPAHIFTSEVCNGAIFLCLQDSFICPLSDFLQHSLLDVHFSRRHALPSAASLLAFSSRGLYLLALRSCPFSQTLTTISHLSSAGRHIIRFLLLVVPSVVT